MKKRALAAALGLATAAPLLGGCGLLGGPDLVIYNAQHEELMTEIVPLFEEQTGLDVELRNGKDLEQQRESHRQTTRNFLNPVQHPRDALARGGSSSQRRAS